MGDIGQAVDVWFRLTIFLGILAILGAWKLVEIVIWLIENVTISCG